MENVLSNICYIIISSCGVALVKYLCSLINKKIDELQVNTEIKEHEKLNNEHEKLNQQVTSLQEEKEKNAINNGFSLNKKIKGWFSQPSSDE